MLKGSDYYWLHDLKRSSTRLTPGWKFWPYQFIRPEHAWLSKRGWVCFKDEWLPPGVEKVPRPEPIYETEVQEEDSPCVDTECSC